MNIKSKAEEAVRLHIAPALQMEPHSIELCDVVDGTAQIRLHGGCGS